MTFDEAVAILQQTEQAMQTALAEERFDDAQSLGQKSVELVKILINLGISAERQDEFLEFAQAYREYASSMLKELTERREQVRKELLNLNKGNRANRSYDLISQLSRP